jgi:hypothetical protein
MLLKRRLITSCDEIPVLIEQITLQDLLIPINLDYVDI